MRFRFFYKERNRTVWSGLLQNFPDAKGKGKGGMRLDGMCTGVVLEAGGGKCYIVWNVWELFRHQRAKILLFLPSEQVYILLLYTTLLCTFQVSAQGRIVCLPL